MQAIEALVVASLSAIMTTAGIKALSPEAAEIAGEIQHAARVQDWKFSYASEISGHDFTAGITSPISTEEIGQIGAAIQAQGIDKDPEVIREAEAAEARFTSTQSLP